MTIEQNLTGVWVGHYSQYGSRRPIAAELIQDGEVLTGTMRDIEPDAEMSVSDIVDEPGEDERIVSILRETYEEAAVGPIRYVSHLPPDSTLEGWARGGGIYLLKSYQGTHFGGFKVGDKLIGREVESHSVHYSGRLGPAGDRIEGRWWIDPSPEGGSRTEGTFELRRLGEGEVFEWLSIRAEPRGAPRVPSDVTPVYADLPDLDTLLGEPLEE